MSKYAKGLKAWGICQRSGKRVLLKDLVRDGHFPELLVAPEWWEPRHPQEFPPPMDEAVALYRPSPEEGMDIPADYVPDPGDPDPEVTYSCTTHLVGTALPGETTFVIEGVTHWLAGDPIYIHMDSGEWFSGQAELDGDTLYITTLQEIPGIASSGACVYIDTEGTGFPLLALEWDQLELVESLSTGDSTSIVSVTASLGFAPYVDYSYELIGTGALLFSVNTDGAIDTTVSLDLDSVPGGTYEMILRATVTDSAGGTASADLPVEITVAPLVVVITEDVPVVGDTFDIGVQNLSVGGYGYELDNAGTIDPDPAEYGGGRIIMVAAYADGVEMYITNGSAITVELDAFGAMTMETSGAPVVLNSADADGSSYAGPGESWWWWALDAAVWDVDDVGIVRTISFGDAVIPDYELYEFNVTVGEWSFSTGSRGFCLNASLDAATCGSIDIENITGDLDITQITFENFGGPTAIVRFEVRSLTDITQAEDFIGIWFAPAPLAEPVQLLFNAADLHVQIGDYESWEWYGQTDFWDAADETEVRQLWLMHLT